MAAYGAGAATGDAGDWILWHGYTFRLAPMDVSFCESRVLVCPLRIPIAGRGFGADCRSATIKDGAMILILLGIIFPLINLDSGHGTGLDDCKSKFKIPWTRIRGAWNEKRNRI